MKRNIEIFRGLGAAGAFEAALIRGLLKENNIPFGGGRMYIAVAAADYKRAAAIVAVAFRPPIEPADVLVAGS